MRKPFRQIRLALSANVERYLVTLSDGCERVRKVCNQPRCFVRLRTNADCLRVTASDLDSGTVLYSWLTLTCKQELCLHFNFPQTGAPPSTVNTFTLRDSVYSLPIDGVLTFTQT